MFTTLCHFAPFLLYCAFKVLNDQNLISSCEMEASVINLQNAHRLRKTFLSYFTYTLLISK